MTAAPNGNPTPPENVRLRDILVALRRRAPLVLGITLATAGLVAYFVMKQQPEYRATAVVRLADVRGSVTRGIEPGDAERPQGGNPLRSQIELLKSRGIIGTVVDAEGLRLRPMNDVFSPALLTQIQIDPGVVQDTFFLAFQKDSVSIKHGSRETRTKYGEPYAATGVRFAVASNPGIDDATLVLSLREKTIDAVLEKLRVVPRDETDIVDVSYSDLAATTAQRVVNRAVRTFHDANIRAAQGQSQRRRLFLEEQLREIDGQLSRAENALTAFRSSQQAYSSREKLRAQEAAVLTLDIRREELDADRRVYETMLSKLQSPNPEQRDTEMRALIALPDLGSNPALAQLYQQRVQYQAARDSLTTGEFRSSASNPDVARLDELIRSSDQRLIAAARGHVGTLEARLDALGTLRDRNAASLEALPRAESAEERLVRQVETNRSLADRLREEYTKARMAEAVEIGQVDIVDLASLPYRPLGRMRVLKLMLGVLMGLSLGGIISLLMDAAQGRIRGRVELEEQMQLPVLSIIPRLELAPTDGDSRARLSAMLRALGRADATDNDANGRKPTTVPTSHAASEAFRLLRSTLHWTQGTEGTRSLVVSSALPQEGKTVTSANLAAVFALEGRRTLLIDCDLRRSRLHRAFRVPRDPGLVQVLRGYVSVADAIRNTWVDNLSFLPAGRESRNPSDLLASAAMRALLTDMREHFDVIVIDTPPVLAAADAAVLGANTDGVLLVVRAGETDRHAVAQALQHLDSVGARVVGAVLNDMRGDARLYGEYSYMTEYSAAGD